jgi:DNA-binding response OmpR family regulator
MDEFNETLEQLELLIGKENAKKVVAFFEGANIYFPKRIGLNELHEQIYTELRRGASYQEMASKYGYTKSYIRKIEHKYNKKNKGRYGRINTVLDINKRRDDKPVKLKPPGIKPFEQGELFYE